MREDVTESNSGSARSRDASIAYAALRIAFGINMAMHGVNRFLVGVGQFAAKMAQEFSATVLPNWMVLAFGHVLPFIEFAIGILLKPPSRATGTSSEHSSCTR